ncbi:unnamed protein product [Hymenolepis diminuta]|uniref:Uncharacterized protein n=1 Tax=Hymenolepis diminuta TaxID=6216 RepID=A0A564Y699_HYMDI|nr:unnamed protein product [Hymenolepis diminuta]
MLLSFKNKSSGIKQPNRHQLLSTTYCLQTLILYFLNLPFVSPDNVHSFNTRAQSSSKDITQPFTPSVQSSLQDTVESTTPPSCISRSELCRTRCGRRVSFPSRLADYVQ